MSEDAAGAPSVSVVIATHNRRERLRGALEPLLAQPELHELVVVVDGSTDGSAELLDGMAGAEPRLRPLVTEARGPMAARLSGALAAAGEVVLALDDDVIAGAGLVAGHARAHSGSEGLVVLGYMPVAARRRRAREFARELYAREYEQTVTTWELDPDSILRSLWMGNFSMRRADFVALAPQAEGVVNGYHEDMDFGLLCLEAGLAGVFERSLRATHLYERDPAGFLRDARSSGRNLPVVHARHTEVLQPLPPNFPWRSLPGPLRGVARAGARLAPLRLLTWAGVSMAGALRLFTLERRGAGLLWRMEQGRAALGRRDG